MAERYTVHMTRSITTDPRLQAAIDRIVAKFHPDRVMLFGSRARGDMREDSDYDLLVVLPQIRDKWSETVAVFRELGSLPISKDIVLATPEEVDRGGFLGSVLRSALREGIVVYERP